MSTTIGIGIGIPFIRPTSGGGGNTPRVAAFLTATGITDATIISALNTMDNELISAGLLPSGTGAGKIKALYPFVGGTASTHKFNFVDPRDLDAAYRLSFNGGWTHSATGALPNGTNAYADTYLIPSVNLTNDDYHFSIYSRTQETASNSSDFGAYTLSGSGSNGLSFYYAAIARKFFATGGYATYYAQSTNNNTLGYLIGNRQSATVANLIFNGNVLASISSGGGDIAQYSIYLGGNNYNNVIVDASQRELAFCTIGNGLTNGQEPNLNTLVTNFQTALGRNV